MIASPTATLAESSSSALIKTLVILLGVLGIVMAIVTVWLVRSTRPDRALLARLEVMSTRQWRKASTSARLRGLETMPAIVKEPTPSGGEDRPAFDHISADAEPAPDVVESDAEIEESPGEIEESPAEIEVPVPDVATREEADTADPARTADAEPSEKAPAAAAGDSDD